MQERFTSTLVWRPWCLVLVCLSILPAIAAPSSSGAIVLSPDERWVYVVNPDSGSVSVIDTSTNSRFREIQVGSDPRCVAVSSDGSTLFVTNQRSNTLTIIDSASLRVTGTIPVDAEPYGVVISADGSTAYVATAANAIIDVIAFKPELPSGRPIRFLFSAPRRLSRIPVGPKPKGVALSGDGRWLYVTHFLTGEISTIDTSSRKIVKVLSTGTDSNMAQKIAIHPISGKGYVPHIRSNVSNGALLFDNTVFPVVSVIDVVAGQSLSTEQIDMSVGVNSTNLPFDIGFAPDGQRAYVVNFGSGEMSVVDFKTRVRVADIDVGDGPRGIVISADGSRAYIANSLSGNVSVIDLRQLRETARIPVTSIPLALDVQRGKVLFFSSRFPQVSSQRWMSCGSCHFEGESDGRTWMFAGSGPRNTPTLRGSSETMPLHWSADRCQFQDFEFTIRELQGGSGLVVNRSPNLPCTGGNQGLSADLDALATFCRTLVAKPSPIPLDSLAVARGAAIFSRADTQCTACHTRPPIYTDSTISANGPILHNVGTGDSVLEQRGSAFDTPSLRMLWDTAPYLHDGSSPSLVDLLVNRNRENRHGSTSHLSPSEIADLVAFLQSL